MLVEKRLSKQYTSLLSSLQTKRTVVLKHLSSSRKEEISFGRFLRNPRVSMASILSEMTKDLSEKVKDRPILLIEDSTEFSFGLHSGITGIGKVGTGIQDGFYSHPVIVLDALKKTCYGLAHCHIYNQNHRHKDQGLDLKARKRESRHIPFEEKDSYRWLGSIIEAEKVCRTAQSMTVIADREGDIYEAMAHFSRRLSIDFLIRMRVNRPVDPQADGGRQGSGGKILDALAATPVKNTYTLDLPATDKRSAHQARLSVKWVEVLIKRPDSKLLKGICPRLKVTAVEVKENPESVVNKEEPVHWILLSSKPVGCFEEACQMIRHYRWRWFIEQLFRLLKSQGLNMAASTLTTCQGLGKLSLMAMDAAVRTLQLLIARDSAVEVPIQAAFSEEEVAVLQELCPRLEGKTDKLKNPYKTQDLRFAVWVIARLAGWSGYQKQPPPGPITLHRGLVRFKQIVEVFGLARSIYQKTTKDVYIT